MSAHLSVNLISITAVMGAVGAEDAAQQPLEGLTSGSHSLHQSNQEELAASGAAHTPPAANTHITEVETHSPTRGRLQAFGSDSSRSSSFLV